MGTKKIDLKSLDSTRKLGKLMGEKARPGDIYCLDGDLGAGKTTLTQSIAQGLDVPDEYYVTSPSYNIFHEYPGRLPLYHMDLYRLNHEEDIIEMGLEEYFYLDGVSVIEWSNKAKTILPAKKLTLSIEIIRDDSRIVKFTYPDDHWAERLSGLLSKLKEQ